MQCRVCGIAQTQPRRHVLQMTMHVLYGSRLATLSCRSYTSFEQRNISQIGYGASIVTKVGSPYRSMARSARLARGVNEVVARRSQTAVRGRFWLQSLDPMGFAIYSGTFFGRVASCSTVNRSNAVSRVGCVPGWVKKDTKHRTRQH